MLLPLVLLVVAILSAAVASYGTASSWVSLVENGMSVICFSRRAGWPLWALCVVCCLALLALVVTGKRRAWWLLGLAPVLVLFFHRFSTGPIRQFAVAEDLPLSNVEDVRSAGAALGDGDNVVGVVIAGTPIAYPTATLWRSPVISQNIFEQKLLLIWSPYANMARAWSADRDLTARELEIVAMPANATLLYNRRYGQFVNGVTGVQPTGASPTGLQRQIPVTQTTWARWKASYPDTRVCLVNAASGANQPLIPEHGVVKRRPATQPTPSASPAAPVMKAKGAAVVLDTTPPILLAPADVTETPLNLLDGEGHALVVYREPANGGVRAYRAEAGQHFARAIDKGFMIETESFTVWSARGRSLETTGPALGKELAPILVHEGVWLEVVRDWLPGAEMHVVGPLDFAKIVPKEPPPPDPSTRPSRRRSRR